MWEMYDELIEGIPQDALVDDIVCGAGGNYVRSGSGAGYAGNKFEDARLEQMVPKKFIGMPLRELAECIKSWVFGEAGVGLAAINAWYNNLSRLRELGIDISDAPHVEDRNANPFIALQNEVKDKNVAIIGHFPFIDQLIAPICNLSIIESHRAKDGDYPEQAADYILPRSDYVIITSYSIIEKTLPRYLKLSEGAHVTLVSPSCPVTPILRRYGVNDMAGFAIKDNEAIKNVCLGLGGKKYAAGQKINYRQDIAL